MFLIAKPLLGIRNRKSSRDIPESEKEMLYETSYSTLLVGLVVGCDDGVFVGCLEGCDDGIEEGCIEGILDGWVEG